MNVTILSLAIVYNVGKINLSKGNEMAKVIISTDSSEVVGIVEIDMIDWVNFHNQKVRLMEIKEWLDHIYKYRKDEE